MIDTTILPALHRVVASDGCNAERKDYVGPLLGNGALSLFLDEQGFMHDYVAFPVWPSPRIYWAGRRLGISDRPLVSCGLLTAEKSWDWMLSTHWEQAMDVKHGVVITTNERGQAREQTETMLLLDRNLLVAHLSTAHLKGKPTLTLTYRFADVKTMLLPAGVTISDGGQQQDGAWLAYQLDGVVTFTGRIALWADRPCRASRVENTLQLQIDLTAASDEITIYLAFADDQADEMFYRQNGWGGRHVEHPMLAPVIADLLSQTYPPSDPIATIAAIRTWTQEQGWAGVRAHQAAQWGDFWRVGWLDLPDAPEVQAIWEMGMYTTRTQLTKWSIPVAIHRDYFNGQYFHDEMAGAQALLAAGHWPLVHRIADLRLSVLPLGMQIVDGAGARNDAAVYEGGYFAVAPMGSSVYEVHANWTPAFLVWNWYRYSGASVDELARYYAIFWGAAEFFRRWMVYQGPDGAYFTGACVDFNESIPAVVNGIATVSAAAGSMLLAARVAELLGRDAELIPRWREIAAGLTRDLPVNSRGLIEQYAGDEGVSFTALRTVAGPFSCGMLPPSDPRVRRTVDAMLRDCKMEENWAVASSRDLEIIAHSMDVGNPNPITWTWTPALAVNVIARMGDGDLALTVIRELLRCSQNFGSLYECKVLSDGYVSLPWFVTSMSELAAAISALFIQSMDEYISLLPAIPQAWRSFSIQLAAYERTIVQLTVQEERLSSLILSGTTGQRKVRIPKRFVPSAILGVPIAEGDSWQEFCIEVVETG